MATKLTKSELSRKRVLDAAAKIFRDYGYAGTTMRAIANEAEMKAGSIYYHYSSKDELIAAVLDLGIRTVIDCVTEAMEALPADATGRQKLEAAIAAHLSAIIDNGDYTLATRRVFGQVPDSIRNQNMKLRDSYAAMWQKILTDAQDQGEFRTSSKLTLARLFLLGALNSAVDWYKPGRQTIDDLAREFSSLAIDGLTGDTADTSKAASSPKKKPAPSARQAQARPSK